MSTHARDLLASAEVFLVFARDIMPTNGCPSEKALKGQFRALFGVSETFSHLSGSAFFRYCHPMQSHFTFCGL